MSQISNEAREVYKITVGLFAAAPGTVYFSALNGALEAGMSVPDLYRTLASNPSFQLQQAAFRAQSTNGQFTNAFLDQLLGNEVTSAGRQFAFDYVMHLLENGTDRGEAMRIALDALDAVPSYDPDFGAAAQRLDHRIDAAQQYTEVFGGSTVDIASLQSAIATVTSDAATVQNAIARWRPPLLTLTSGVDAGLMFIGTSANDIFSAPAVEGTRKQTLNTFDNLSGGNGSDTLNATVGYEEARPTLHSIENVILRFDGTNPLNLSDSDGIRGVTVQNSTQVGTLSGVGTIDTFTVRDQRVGIVFDASITTALVLTFDHVGSRGSPVDFKFGTSIAVQTRTLALTLDDAHVQLIPPVAPTLNTLRIVASGENSLHLTPTWASQMILISGDGDVDFGTSPLTETTILDAATASGDLRFQADKSAVKVVTGSGNDSITYVAPIRAGSDIDLGAGDDRLVLGGVVAPYVPINGGPGNDTIRVDDGSWISREVFLNPATELPYEGFETLEAVHGQYLMPKLAGVKNVTVDQTALTDVTLVRAASDTTLTYNVQQPRTAQDTSTLNVWMQEKTDGPVKLNVVLNAVDRVNDGVAGGTARTDLILSDCDVLTITSNVLQTDRSLKASDYHNVIDDLAAFRLQTVIVRGDAGLDLGIFGGAGMVSKIDASGATGGVTVNAFDQWQPVEFLGSRGNDVYIGATHPDTINAGRGSDVVVLPLFSESDRLIFSAGDSTLSRGPQRTHDLVMCVGALTGNAPTIDLSSLAFPATRTAAVADKGILADSAVNGTTLFQPGWFISGGSAHAVAIGTRPLSADPIELPSQWRGLMLPTSTYVFVDVNKSGDFEASSDLFIEIAGVGQMSLANFVF